MATQPGPDIIEPSTPPEIPATPAPTETPNTQPPEIMPPQPDIDNPDRSPAETPPPPQYADGLMLRVANARITGVA